MAEAKPNTTKDLEKGKQATASQLDKEMKEAAKVLGEQKKVSYTIPKYLKKRIGSTLPLGINGAVIHVPVGEKVDIPESYKQLLDQSLENLKL